jgi:hypothetical protein
MVDMAKAWTHLTSIDMDVAVHRQKQTATRVTIRAAAERMAAGRVTREA